MPAEPESPEKSRVVPQLFVANDADASEWEEFDETLGTICQGFPQLTPPNALKVRLLSKVSGKLALRQLEEAFEGRQDAVVVADANGCVSWVNAGFTSLCGYSIEELRGRKPGSLLQGTATDSAAVKAMRDAVIENTFCSVELVNYHKNGDPYLVSIDLAPLASSPGAQPHGYIAFERKIRSLAA